MIIAGGENSKQVAKKSWFPLPLVWHSSGFDWLEWTDTDEVFFKNILADVQSGLHKPKAHDDWRTSLRGTKESRSTITNNTACSKAFLAQKFSLAD